MKCLKKFVTVFFLSFYCLASGAFAQERETQDVEFGIMKHFLDEEEEDMVVQTNAKTPRWINKFVYDVTFHDEYQSTNRKEEFKDTRSNAYFASSLQLSKHFLVNTSVILERSEQGSETTRRDQLANGGGDRSFENEGVFLEELNLAYDGKTHAILLGKFNVNFGNAWRWDRGIWAHEIAQNYRQKEKLGVAGIVRAGDLKKTGSYKFGYALFKNDRQYLDNAVITGRDSDAKSDALPGDTGGLQSYLGSIDVSFDFGELEKLSYHFAYMNLAVSERNANLAATKIDDEKAFVLGMRYQVPLSQKLFDQDVILDWMVEYAALRNVGGDGDVSENYLTSNLITRFYSDFNMTLSYSKRRNSEMGEYGFDQQLTEISLGYQIGENDIFDKVVFQLGYKNQRDNLESATLTRNSFGGLVRLYKSF